jgi:hypothetical protein
VNAWAEWVIPVGVYRKAWIRALTTEDTEGTGDIEPEDTEDTGDIEPEDTEDTEGVEDTEGDEEVQKTDSPLNLCPVI